MLAHHLEQHQEEVFLIDLDHSKISERFAAKFPVILGDARSPNDLARAGADRAKTLVAVTDNDELNLQACRAAKDFFNVANTIALINDPVNVERANELGIITVTPELSTLMIMDQLVRHPSSYRLLTQDEQLRIADIELRNATVAGHRIRSLRCPGNSLLVAVIRGEERIIPHGNTMLKLDDTLIILGTPDELDEAQQLFDPRGLSAGEA